MKERRNEKGTEEIEALQKIDEILQNLPTTPTTKVTATVANETGQPPKEMQQEPRVRKQPLTGGMVTFDKSCKPPKEMQLEHRVQRLPTTTKTHKPITSATVSHCSVM